jgi:predicted component of type VI protein secretion system
MAVEPEEDVAMNVHLTVLSGRHRGRTIPITHSPFLIGRDPAAHLRPTSSTISEQHCAILVDERRTLVQDFANSTRVNERPIEGAAELTDGDRLQIGPLVFRFSVECSQPVPEMTAGDTSPSEDDEAAAAAMLLSMTDKPTRPTSKPHASAAGDWELANAASAPTPPSELSGTVISAREILKKYRNGEKEIAPAAGTISKRFEARPTNGGPQMASVYNITETRPQHVVIQRFSGPRAPEGFRQVHASIEEATQHLRELHLGYRITMSDPDK